MFWPAILPIVLALSSCSTRRREPRAGLGKLATSPAAYTSGWLVRQNSSTTMPFSTSNPACSASSTLGWMPRPATTMSPAISAPVVVRTMHLPPRAPGGEPQLLEPVHRAPVVGDAVPPQIDADHTAAELQVGTGLRRLAPDAVLRVSLPQALRERRAIVGGVRLGADQRQRAGG